MLLPVIDDCSCMFIGNLGNISFGASVFIKTINCCTLSCNLAFVLLFAFYNRALNCSLQKGGLIPEGYL